MKPCSGPFSRRSFLQMGALGVGGMGLSVYRHLGINQHDAILDYTGRPQHILPFGEPIRELV
jgi:hypothetical protein